jgi:hypothetical protein
MDPKYPNIEVQLTGNDGNAYYILGSVSRALRRGGVSPDEVSEFTSEATSGTYDHLLRTCMKWVTVY